MGGAQVRWVWSDLVVDLLAVFRITDQHVLIEELCLEVAPLARAERQRSLELLRDPEAAPGSSEVRVHAASGAGLALLVVSLRAVCLAVASPNLCPTGTVGLLRVVPPPVLLLLLFP